jgi:hypothetical protein
MPPHSPEFVARCAQAAADAIREPVAQMDALVRQHYDAVINRTPKPRLLAPSGAPLLKVATTRGRRALLGEPTKPRLTALLETYRAAGSSAADKASALDALRVFAATTPLGRSPRFFGGSLHKNTDMFDAAIRADTPLGFLYRAVFGGSSGSIARVVSEATVPRLIGGTVVVMLDEHAANFHRQLDLGLYNGLVCGAAVRVLRAANMMYNGHLQALLAVNLPAMAHEYFFAYMALPDGGKGPGKPRGQPGALARAAGEQAERPLRANGLPLPR